MVDAAGILLYRFIPRVAGSGLPLPLLDTACLAAVVGFVLEDESVEVEALAGLCLPTISEVDARR